MNTIDSNAHVCSIIFCLFCLVSKFLLPHQIVDESRHESHRSTQVANGQQVVNIPWLSGRF